MIAITLKPRKAKRLTPPLIVLPRVPRPRRVPMRVEAMEWPPLPVPRIPKNLD